MDHIRTVGDLIDHYSGLYDFWTKEINRIVVYNKLQYEEAELSNKKKKSSWDWRSSDTLIL